MKSLLQLKTMIACGILALALRAAPAASMPLDEIARDFKPVAGVVVMTEGPEVILDLDAAAGVSPGDVCSVLAPGRQIVHPVTKKVLGTLEDVKAVLKVVRLKTGFSYARPLGGGGSLKPGDPVRTWASLPAVFWDYTADGKQAFLQLQSALPDLKWQDYENSQKTRPPAPATAGAAPGALTFILTRDAVEVRDPESVVLKTYRRAGAAALAAPVAAPAAAPRADSGPAPAVRPVYGKTETLANLADAALMADFVRHGDRLLMAATNGPRIDVFDATGVLSRITARDLPRPGTVLALKWWQPAAGGGLYLAVTAWIDNAVSSSIWTFEKDALSPGSQQIPRILGAFDIDRDGRPETLLAQEFDAGSFFGQRIKEVRRVDGEVRFSDPKVALPRNFTVIGSAISDLTGDGQPEAIFIRNEVLFVYSGSRQLFKSPKEMGGSVSVLTYDSSASVKNMEPGSAVFEVSPVCVDLDRNGSPEVLVAASDRTMLGSMVPAVGGIKRSWVAVVRYQNGRFESGTLGDKLDQPLQGLTVHGERVLLVATETGDMTGEGARSHLLAFALAR
jgi:hypothetical protein